MIALIPDNWLKNAIKKASNMGSLYFPEMNSLNEVSSDLDPEANNSSTRLSAVDGLIIFNTSLASSTSPFFTINHLGLLGTKRTKTRNSKTNEPIKRSQLVLFQRDSGVCKVIIRTVKRVWG